MALKVASMWKWKKECVKYLPVAAAFVFGVLPYLIMVWYAVPIADDFTYANDIARYGGYNLKGIFNMVKSFYMGWQGTYFAAAIGGLVPIHSNKFRGINAILFIIILLLIITVIILINKLCADKFDKHMVHIITALVILGIFEAGVAKEVLFWYEGAGSYTVPFIVGCSGSICMIKLLEVGVSEGKSKYIIAASILGVLSSGGSLQNAGFFCWINLLFLSYVFMFHRKELRYHFIPFACTVAGALVNATAPGNYVRKATSGFENISVIKAVEYTLLAVGNELRYLFSQTYVPIILLVIAILAVLFIKPVENVIWHPLVVSVAMAVGWIISTFPYCYGYSSSALQERNASLLDWFLVIGVFLIIISIANWCKLKAVTISSGAIYVTVLLVMINLGFLQNIIPITEMPSVRCWIELLSGEAKDYHDEWIAVFETIENSDEATVEVLISDEANSYDRVLKHPGMTDSFKKWVNIGIAEFYGKEKVRIIIMDTINDN